MEKKQVIPFLSGIVILLAIVFITYFAIRPNYKKIIDNRCRVKSVCECVDNYMKINLTKDQYNDSIKVIAIHGLENDFNIFMYLPKDVVFKIAESYIFCGIGQLKEPIYK